MTFEAFNYDQKRVRSAGTREWKLWFSETGNGLDFRMLTKDNASDCYVILSGLATAMPGDLPIQESDSGEAYVADHFRHTDAEGGISLFLEHGERDLVWVRGFGKYGQEDCSFEAPGPLMPETAG